MCHNGEINTLRGNVSRMRAREELMQSDIFGDDIKIIPYNTGWKIRLCFYGYGYRIMMTGRSLPEVMMMVVPEAWEKHQTMSDDKSILRV
jgi:glutamate synthase (ferredoxin)